MKHLIELIESGAELNLGQFLSHLGSDLPLLYELKNTPQDPEWHAEGDVHIHTDMVLEESYKIIRNEASYLSTRNRTLLTLGALLHDIAKPKTTRRQEVKGVVRTVARGHEALGRSYLSVRLLELGLPFTELETLVGLVGYHHLPKLLAVKDAPRNRYLQLSHLADPELLYWLEVADMRGRTSTSKEDSLAAVELYRLYAEEHQAFVRFGKHSETWRDTLRSAFPKANQDRFDLIYARSLRSLESGDINSVEEAIARAYQIKDDFPEVVLTFGPSGAGKSTLVDRYFQEGFEVISLDQIRKELTKKKEDQSINGRVLAVAKERLKDGLRKKKKIVWEATSLRRDFRTQVIDLGRKYGALTTTIAIQQSIKGYQERNRGRSDGVAESTLEKQLEQMEWPELNEADRTIYLNANHQIVATFGCSAEHPYKLPSASVG